jgi:predicted dehydrogenase
MNRTRIGIVGVGTWGANHARVLASLPEAELVGYHDLRGDRAEDAERRWGGKAFAGLDMLLGEVEAVVVAVPTTSHLSVALRALEKGVHVLVEKPIASDSGEADRMVEAAEKAGRVLAVGHVERFNPAVQALLAARAEPRFVEIHRLSPFHVRGLDVSVVLDLMIHDIDVLLCLARSPLRDLDAVGVPVLSASVDIANARLRFESGCVANLTASRISLGKVRKIRVFEANRYVSVNYTDQTVTAYRRAGDLPPPEELTPESFARFVEREEIAVEKGEPLEREVRGFLDLIRTGNGAVVTGREGSDALAVALRILERMDTGHGLRR